VKIEIGYEAADEIVRASLKEDLGLLEKEIARLDRIRKLTSVQLADLENNKRYLRALEVLRECYGI